MNMQVSPAGVALTKEMEGCVLHSYPDPGTGGAPWTAGFGHTGPEVKPGMTITQAQADAWLNADLARASLVVNSLVRVYLTQGEHDALTDFVFNVGAGNFRGSTLLRLLNAGDSKAAAQQFERWNMASGRILPGLVRRRAKEKALFLTPDYPTAA